MRKRLALLWNAANQPLKEHTRHPSCTRGRLENAPVCNCGQTFWILDAPLKNVMECCAHIFKFHEKAELPGVSPLKNWRSFLLPPSLPERTMSSDPFQGCAHVSRRFFFWLACASCFCFTGLGRPSFSPARTSLPSLLSFLKAGTVEDHSFVAPFGSCVEFPFSIMRHGSINSINVNQSLADSKFPAEVFAAHEHMYDRRRTFVCALYAPSSCLRCSLTCAGRTPASLVDLLSSFLS